MSGQHLIIDGKMKEKLTRGKLTELVFDICDAINMYIIFGPKTVKGAEKNPGYTSFAIIEFSNVCIHTFDKNGWIAVDIFSCKKFNEKKVKKLLSEYLEVKQEHSVVRMVKR